MPIEGLNKYVSWRDGLYDVTAFWVTRQELLHDHTIFQCVLRIADSNYLEKREISYSPGKKLGVASVSVYYIITLAF